MKVNSVDKKKLIGRLSIYHSALVLLVICVFATILSPSLLNVANLFDALKQITVAGIMKCGMTFVTLTGEIDFFVGSILGLAGVLVFGIPESMGNTEVAIPAAPAVGIGCGVVDSFSMVVCEILPFVSTLSMVALLRGRILAYTEGFPIPTKVDGYKFFGKGTVAEVPVPVIILIILFLIVHYVLIQASYDRSIHASGGNREVARPSDISTCFIRWMTYALNSLMCGVAGVVLTARLDPAQSTSGTGIEMDTIATVVLGGTPLSSGIGFVPPTVASAMIMDIIDSVLVLVNVNPHATNTVKDAVILIAVLVDKEVKDLSTKAGRQIENRVSAK